MPLVVLLTTAGLHTPFILFVDVEGNVGTVPPSQIEPLVLNVKLGVIVGSIVTVSVVPVTQPGEVAVNT